MTPIRIGLAGAGPWAQMVHAPSIAAAPEFQLAAVWARRPEAAAELATRHNATPFTEYGAFLRACDAVVCSVPPDVQPALAVAAAEAGKALLLEKPLAATLPEAERLARVVTDARVPNMLVLTWRFSAAVRQFVAEARALEPIGGRAVFAGGGFLPGSPFATPWRLERGPLLDLGPHVIDLLEATLGPVERVAAHGDRHGWVGLALEHAGGAHSEASFCATAKVAMHTAGAEVFGRRGVAKVDCAATASPTDFATLYREFAAVIRGELEPIADVQRGLELQRIITAAGAQLG
ncbi:MAG: Gfo/Idh/MocA family protein [Dehalococcoidia bacterium]